MKPLEGSEAIFQVAFGYMASKGLFAALHVGVFDALAEGPRELEALAQETGAEARPLLTLLTALTAIGLLERGPDGWSNSPAAELHLVRGSPADLGDYLRGQIDQQMYPLLHRLPEALRPRGEPGARFDYEQWFRDAEQARLYSEAQHTASVALPLLASAIVDLSDRHRLLDVGGGSGAFAIGLCQQQPRLRATLLDFPNVIEVARKAVADAGLESRFSFVEGNALDTDWPGDQDLVLFSYVSGSVSAEGVAELYRRAARSLRPDGLVLVHDFMVDDDRRGPPLTALWALQHVVFTPGAIGLTPGFVCDLLGQAGFVEARVHEFVPGMTRLVVARKPA